MTYSHQTYTTLKFVVPSDTARRVDDAASRSGLTTGAYVMSAIKAALEKSESGGRGDA